MAEHPISRIIYCTNIALVTLPEVPSDSAIQGEIFTSMAEGGINVDVISQTAPRGGSVSMAFSVSMDAVGSLLPIVAGLKNRYPGLRCEISSGMTKVNFYDSNMVNTPGVAALVFRMLHGIQIHTIATTSVDVSIVIQEHDLEEVCKRCHEALGVEPEEVLFQ